MLYPAVMLLGISAAADPAPPQVDFERHVVSLFGRAGCNTGACHGSFQGKGGLRLSLFGYEPDRDFRALTRDAGGRRVDPYDPDHSLMLLKATGQVPHGGGRRIVLGSWEYRVLRDWITDGCRHQPGSGTVARLEVEPREFDFHRPGEETDVRVRAIFADGSAADVAAFCEFRVKDESVAEVTDRGRVKAVRPGDTAVIVAYRGTVAAMRVYIPVPAERRTPNSEHGSAIDRSVIAKLRRLNIEPSGLSSDEEFLRRVTIDAIGSLPTPDDVRSFLADRRPDKRSRKIDELLAHPRHAALWASKFCDITGCNVETMDGPPEVRPKLAQMWHDWFRVRLAADVPYDKIARGVLLATSRERNDISAWIKHDADLDRSAHAGFVSRYADRQTLDLFWRRIENNNFFPIEKMAELTSAAFLGVRLECAQCHKHPFDRWTQEDYRGYANIFGHVRFDSSPELTAIEKPPSRRMDDPLMPVRRREVYVTDRPMRMLPNPDGKHLLKPRALGGPELHETKDPREPFVNWLVQPDNPYFARSFVNRVWAHYFGVGIVDPVDDFSAANPPSNERLLDALARDFVEHGYDIRRLEREVLNSRTYQLTSLPNESNRGDRLNYSHGYARPMPAEVVLDVLDDALGASEDFGPDAPPHSRAIEVATNKVTSPHAARVFRVFGRPGRTTTCDCERPTAPALPQTLYLMSDPALLKKITDGRLRSLLAGTESDSQLIDELFLATLSRFPDAREKSAALDRITAADTHTDGCIDVMWALINTREFILNH
ncbi:MAG TPA: DUF1549 domain-containing protein [Gemmataceae bacterium]|nr:DUF1549 domain-containing protein [Gemmataceae bacterium]